MEDAQSLSVPWAFLYAYYADKMNACVHMAPVKFSPITFALARDLDNMRRTYALVPGRELNEVLSHVGAYELDKGR